MQNPTMERRLSPFRLCVEPPPSASRPNGRGWRLLPYQSPFLALVPVCALALACSCRAQGSGLPDAPQPQTAVTVRNTPRHILSDQAAIWTSPARLRDSNLAGPTLLVLATAVLMTTDHQIMSTELPKTTSMTSHAVTASNGLVGGFVAAPVLFYGLGRIHRDSHATETGILGGEAMVDSFAVNEVLKLVAQRERPTVDGARGRFFQSGAGWDSSFPSSHSVVAWSSAAVLASEYPSPLATLGAYGLAAGVSATRVIGRQHFPSDVFAAAGVGWMIGRYVFHRHSRAE